MRNYVALFAGLADIHVIEPCAMRTRSQQEISIAGLAAARCAAGLCLGVTRVCAYVCVCICVCRCVCVCVCVRVNVRAGNMVLSMYCWV